MSSVNYRGAGIKIEVSNKPDDCVKDAIVAQVTRHFLKDEFVVVRLLRIKVTDNVALSPLW